MDLHNTWEFELSKLTYQKLISLQGIYIKYFITSCNQQLWLKMHDNLKLSYFSKIIMHVENMVVVDCVINLIRAKKLNAKKSEVSLTKFYIN